jgi:hypothetical protein
MVLLGTTLRVAERGVTLSWPRGIGVLKRRRIVPRCRLKSERYASRTVTLRPSPFNLWVVPIIALAGAGFLLWGGHQMLVQQGLGDPWLVGAGGVVAIVLCVVALVAVAVGARKAYIRVDDSTITFGPSLTAFAARRNSFNRREVVAIRATRSPMTRLTLFLRSDGSTVNSTPGYFWGRDGLQRLADYLGVPLEW